MKNLLFTITYFLSIRRSAEDNVPDFKLFNLTEFYSSIQDLINK